MRFKVPKPKSKYYMEPELYRAVVTWCRCYPLWVKELQTLPDPSRAINYDKDRIQSSPDGDPTSDLAIKRVGIERKVTLLETTIQTYAPEIYEYMLKGITQSGYRVEDLIQQGMPCGKKYFANKRAQIYFNLSKRI